MLDHGARRLSVTGMRAAVAAGIPTVGVLSGQSAQVLLEAGASFLVHDFRDIVSLCEAEAANVAA